MDPVEIDTVLASLDRNEGALDAAEYAVAVADRYDADVHALYLLGSDLAHDLDAGEIDREAVAAETEAFMDDVQSLAAAHDVTLTHSTAYGFRPSQLTHHPGSVILDAADDLGADFLVVPREPVTGEPGVVLGKAAEYVLMYASQPVLSV